VRFVLGEIIEPSTGAQIENVVRNPKYRGTGDVEFLLSRMPSFVGWLLSNGLAADLSQPKRAFHPLIRSLPAEVSN
jgi:hypothetical protein